MIIDVSSALFVFQCLCPPDCARARNVVVRFGGFSCQQCASSRIHRNGYQVAGHFVLLPVDVLQGYPFKKLSGVCNVHVYRCEAGSCHRCSRDAYVNEKVTVPVYLVLDLH